MAESQDDPRYKVKNIIDAMYSDKSELAVKGQVRYRDGHIGTIETKVKILDV